MSDKEKRDRALQRRVRERQAKTGESYQAAWRQLTGIDAPTSAVDALKKDASEEAASPPPNTARIILPLNLPRVPPHQSMRVTARAYKGAVDIERIVISNAGTIGGAADWIVNDIEVDGRSQLALKDLSGALFAGHGIAANPKATTSFSISGFDAVERNHEFAIMVTYIGPNPEGVPFFGAAIGSPPPQRPTIVPIASKISLKPLLKTTITARVQSAPFQMDRLEIQNGETPGGAADWIVNDLRINSRSQFKQSGDVPGDLFSTKSIDSFIKLEACAIDNTIELDLTYIGLNEDGDIFTARLEGTVVRDDYNSAPPDLRVLVETSGQGPGDTVIASCNWRAPATDNRTR